MAEFTKNPFTRLKLRNISFVHRGNCEFDIIRQPNGSFMPWSVHSMIEGSSVGLSRKMACEWTEKADLVTAQIMQANVGRITWQFFPGPKELLRFTITLSNLSQSDWKEVSVNVHNFPCPRLFRGAATYAEANGLIKELRELWPAGVNAAHGVYPFKGKDVTARYAGNYWTVVPCALSAPFVYRIGGGNEPTPHARWCESRPIVMGIVCERINAVLSNYDWPCLDLDMDFGEIPSGESASQSGLIGIMEGNAEDFLECVRGFLALS